MRLTYSRFLAVLDAAESTLDAYERFAAEIVDAAAQAREASDFRARVAAIVSNVDYRPAPSAIALLQFERLYYERNATRLERARQATATSRTRAAAGTPAYGKGGGGSASRMARARDRAAEHRERTTAGASDAIASYLAKQAEIAALAQEPLPQAPSDIPDSPQALHALDGHGAAALDFGASADASAENEK